MDSDDSPIHYLVPWYSFDFVADGSIDVVLSQAVLEHVDEPGLAYRKMHSWLNTGGYVSHTIDYQCHRTAKVWNGHWTYSDLTWKLIRGKRPYLINRLTHSRHLELMSDAGFDVLSDMKYRLPSQIDRKRRILCDGPG